jgi:hypothetical protein
MATALINRSRRLRDILERLSAQSVEDYYNPYKTFEWPESLPTGIWWMSPELMTTAGHELETELNIEQRQRLSRAESINFYSLNVHGIRELLIEVTRRIHTREFAAPSEYFHHFIGEENEHMWFFAEFCLRYGGKIYTQPRGGAAAVPPSRAESLLVFARILIFEELVDHYNMTMAADARLHDTVRAVNRIHHQDESRHIAFGRELVKVLFGEFKADATQTELDEVEDYLKRYMNFSFESLFNPQVYKDAGLPRPLEIRTRLLSAPERTDKEKYVFRKTLPYLQRVGIISNTDLDSARSGSV